jgi:rfaE bifunctional protein nucleotidyltransferase chain/domain
MDYLKHINNKIISADYFKSKRKCFNNNRVIFTNGCFDILHLGHIDYLIKARKLGDVLIIGLNTDNSVKKLKGEKRPVNNQNARALLLASLEFVDFVILFDEETPMNLIKMITPDVLVKGGDYTIESVVGADFVLHYGGAVEIFPFLEGYSTTAIINNLQNN